MPPTKVGETFEITVNYKISKTRKNALAYTDGLDIKRGDKFTFLCNVLFTGNVTYYCVKWQFSLTKQDGNGFKFNNTVIHDVIGISHNCVK